MCNISIAASVCRNKIRKGIISISTISELGTSKQRIYTSVSVEVDNTYLMNFPNVVLKEMRRIKKHYPQAIFTIR